MRIKPSISFCVVGILVVGLGAVRPAAGQQGTVDGFRYPLDLEPHTYKMISSPYVFERNSFREVFEDDYGPYAPGAWRLYYYNTLSETYEEYPAIDEVIEPGTAVWLITRDGAPFDLFAMDEPAFVPAETVVLEAYPGWNQFGIPFDYPIPCKALLDQARERPEVRRVEGPVFFDGEQYRYNVEVCDPWEGYFVYIETDLPLLPVPIPPEQARRENEPNAAPVTINTETEYLLQLSAVASTKGVPDTQNFVGLLHTASEGLDTHDFREAPPITDDVHLSVVEGGRRFAGNFKPTTGEGQQWDFVLQAPSSGQTVDVALQESGRRPVGHVLYVLDRDRGVVVPIRENTFQVQLDNKGAERHFSLLLGTPAYVEDRRSDIPLVPTSYALSQNYPNPFNAETVIRYQLGQRSRVVLDVYDMLGRRVRRLVDARQPAGSHEVRWDSRADAGQPVANGLYVYRLRAGDFTDTKKMILLR